jgi:hypothetical protein
VILRTEWDSSEDASEFSDLLDRWVREGSGEALVLPSTGTTVNAGFASGPEIMPALESALRSL